jgi:MFS transporter, DHA2 family, multidrug resistance protein
MHHAHLSEAVNAGNIAAMQALTQLTASGQSTEQASATLNRLLDQQAFTLAATDAFYLSAGLFVLLIGMVWLTKPTPTPLAGGADASGAH